MSSVLILNGVNLYFYNPRTLELMKKEKLPIEHDDFCDSECKNYQIGEDEVGFGGYGFFRYNMKTSKCQFYHSGDRFLTDYMDNFQNYFLVASKSIHVVDMKTNQQVFEVPFPKEPSRAKFLNSNLLCAQGGRLKLHLVDYVKQIDIDSNDDHEEYISDLEVKKSVSVFFSGSFDGYVNIFSYRNRSMEKVNSIHYPNCEQDGHIPFGIRSLLFLEDRNLLFAGDNYNGNLYCSDIRYLKGFVFQKDMKTKGRFAIYGIIRMFDNTKVMNNTIITGDDKYIKIVDITKNGKVLASTKTGDRVWRMNMYVENKQKLESVLEDRNDRIKFWSEQYFDFRIILSCDISSTLFVPKIIILW